MATMTPSVKERAYAAAHFALELDGKKDDVGLFRSVEGGSIKADVMTYQNGANYDRWRQLGKPKFEDIKVSVGMSMTKPFYAWISEFFTGKGTRKTGAILAADYNYETRARREFSEALIKEITFPKLDGTDKTPAYMGVSLAVENIEFKTGDGAHHQDRQLHDQAEHHRAPHGRLPRAGEMPEPDGLPLDLVLRARDRRAAADGSLHQARREGRGPRSPHRLDRMLR